MFHSWIRALSLQGGRQDGLEIQSDGQCLGLHRHRRRQRGLCGGPPVVRQREPARFGVGSRTEQPLDAVSYPERSRHLRLRAIRLGVLCRCRPTRQGKQERWPRGRVVGGSSSINGMNYVRGAACDFDRWAALGNQGWSAQDVLPLYREIERCNGSIREADKDGLRGYEGSLHVKTVGGRHGRHVLTQAFIEAAQGAGYPFNPDYNGASQEGVGYTQASSGVAGAGMWRMPFSRPCSLGTTHPAERCLGAQVQRQPPKLWDFPAPVFTTGLLLIAQAGGMHSKKELRQAPSGTRSGIIRSLYTWTRVTGGNARGAKLRIGSRGCRRERWSAPNANHVSSSRRGTHRCNRASRYRLRRSSRHRWSGGAELSRTLRQLLEQCQWLFDVGRSDDQPVPGVQKA